jgi:hypothetical protein
MKAFATRAIISSAHVPHYENILKLRFSTCTKISDVQVR